MNARVLLTCLLAGCAAPLAGPGDLGSDPTGDQSGKGDGDDGRLWIGVEIDYVGYQRLLPGTRELLQGYFESIGYALDIEESDELEPVDVLEYGSGNPMLARYYEGHFAHRGEPGWHYLLVGDTVAGYNRGWGMLGGDMFLISADPIRLHPDDQETAQANIILHELGHNLGLVHEGLEPERSAGTHDKSSCATADRGPAPAVPVVRYSPTCAAHLVLESRPFLP